MWGRNRKNANSFRRNDQRRRVVDLRFWISKKFNKEKVGKVLINQKWRSHSEIGKSYMRSLDSIFNQRILSISEFFWCPMQSNFGKKFSKL